MPCRQILFEPRDLKNLKTHWWMHWRGDIYITPLNASTYPNRPQRTPKTWPNRPFWDSTQPACFAQTRLWRPWSLHRVPSECPGSGALEFSSVLYVFFVSSCGGIVSRLSLFVVISGFVGLVCHFLIGYYIHKFFTSKVMDLICHNWQLLGVASLDLLSRMASKVM